MNQPTDKVSPIYEGTSPDGGSRIRIQATQNGPLLALEYLVVEDGVAEEIAMSSVYLSDEQVAGLAAWLNASRSAERAQVAGKDGLWMVYYEDAEVKPEVFFGPGAEQAARGRFEVAEDNWSCHLLARICTPVYGSCRLTSEHKGQHDASAPSSARPAIPEGWKLERDGGTIWVSSPEFSDCGVNHTGKGDLADLLWGLADALLKVTDASASAPSVPKGMLLVDEILFQTILKQLTADQHRAVSHAEGLRMHAAADRGTPSG